MEIVLDSAIVRRMVADLLYAHGEELTMRTRGRRTAGVMVESGDDPSSFTLRWADADAAFVVRVSPAEGRERVDELRGRAALEARNRTAHDREVARRELLEARAELDALTTTGGDELELQARARQLALKRYERACSAYVEAFGQ